MHDLYRVGSIRVRADSKFTSILDVRYWWVLDMLCEKAIDSAQLPSDVEGRGEL